MKKITYTLLNKSGEKIKTVQVYERDPVYIALETYLKIMQAPQIIEELNILIEKIEET
jgi:hypothetical protein